MDSQPPSERADENVEEVEGDEVEGTEDEVEVTREELVTALQGVVSDLSSGLKGPERDAYIEADDLAQNDWFFAGIAEDEVDGQYAVTMWPAEGEDDMLRIDIGNEDDVHKLASSPDMVEAMIDDFIEAMGEEYDDDEYEEYEEGEDEEDELEDDEEELTEDDPARHNGNLPPPR